MGADMSDQLKPAPPSSRRSRLPSIDPQKLVLPGIIALIALVSGFVEPRYWTAQNLVNLGRQIAPLLILIRLEQFDYVGATAIGVAMLVVSLVMLLVINLLQWWSRRHQA